MYLIICYKENRIVYIDEIHQNEKTAKEVCALRNESNDGYTYEVSARRVI